MSGGSSGRSGTDDLFEIRERFKELTKEKEMLTDSKFKSFDLIRSLEYHVKTLSESREEDKKHIEDLERELNNCCQEIDHLQDQLNTRNQDLSCLGDHICSLQLKLSDTENLAEEVIRLRKQLRLSESERSLLTQEIEDKEVELRCSAARGEKLEESISSMGLDYQCEIESLRLESTALEENLIETRKLLDERDAENSKMHDLILDLQIQIEDANMVIEGLQKENRCLKEKLRTSHMNTNASVQKTEDWFEKNASCLSSEQDKDTRVSGAYLHDKMAEMSRQIEDYELLLKQLKDELRKEKLKAKEEAEDLAQEMAELRYQLTSMLEEECKRRANIEQISLQRISELEAQIARERKTSIDPPQDLVVRKQ